MSPIIKKPEKWDSRNTQQGNIFQMQKAEIFLWIIAWFWFSHLRCTWTVVDCGYQNNVVTRTEARCFPFSSFPFIQLLIQNLI